MRPPLVGALLALAALVAPVAAGALTDPGRLVLRQADLPAGFAVDRDETGLRTNALEAREVPETRNRFRRWGRGTGYQARFVRGHASIEARVDVFRGAGGASRLLEWVRSEARRSGFHGQKLARFRIGAEGLILWVGDSLTLVTWRQGRVFAAVFGDELPRARLVALARVQQRRIVAELR